MESEENEASPMSSCETDSVESYDAKQRSEESTAAPSVDTQHTVSHRSRSSLETEAGNRRASLHLQSEVEERLYSLSQKSSISSALNFSQHFSSKKTDLVEGGDVSYADTFDSLDSISESDDELQKTPSGDRFDSIGDQSSSSGSQSSFSGDQSSSGGHRSSSSQLLSSHEEKMSVENRSKSSYCGAEDTPYSEEEDTRSSFSDRLESISSEEGGIRSLSLAVEDNGLPSLGLSSDSSVWSPSGSIFDQNTTDHSVEDKFTSADGEIIYYSDFSIEALTARQYTQRSQRSDILEWSQNLKNATIIPESEEFVQKKIQLLRRQSLCDKTETSVRSHNAEKDLEKVESMDLKDFCSKKCHNLKNYRMDSGACKSLSPAATNFYRRLKDDSDVISYGIPFSVIQCLRIDMKSKIDFHEPSTCDRCRQKLGQLGLSEFLQSKIVIVREQLTNLKLKDARYASTYGMTVIGEILSEASCLSCKPELVMQRLLEPLNARKISNETVKQPA